LLLVKLSKRENDDQPPIKQNDRNKKRVRRLTFYFVLILNKKRINRISCFYQKIGGASKGLEKQFVSELVLHFLLNFPVFCADEHTCKYEKNQVKSS
jgi:hypothetical protein